MIYELPSDFAGAHVTASLLLAADRALLSTPLSRVNDVPAGAWLTPGRLKVAAKTALVARGITRKTPVAKGLLRLGIRGWLSVAREVMAPPRVTSRAAYLVEYGDVPPEFSGLQSESLTIEAAAILSGIYGFLSDIPALTRRRQDVQRRRCVSDEEIVNSSGRTGLPVPARFQ